MTLRPHRDQPCWEIVRKATGRPPEEEWGDGWAHYATQAEAARDLAEREAEWADDHDSEDHLEIARSFDGPCLGLFCDGEECDGEPIDCSGEGWTHLDPADPTPFQFSDVDVTERDGKHYCEACTYSWAWCDHCDDRHPLGDCEASSAQPEAWRPVPVHPDQGALL